MYIDDYDIENFSEYITINKKKYSLTHGHNSRLYWYILVIK